MPDEDGVAYLTDEVEELGAGGSMESSMSYSSSSGYTSSGYK
jgi:hypothetical protein